MVKFVSSLRKDINSGLQKICKQLKHLFYGEKMKKYETDVLLDEIKRVYETHYTKCKSKAVHDLYNAIIKRIRRYGHIDESNKQTERLGLHEVADARVS